MGPPPVVTGISPKEGPPGTRVTIRGEFLGIGATDLIGLKICGCDCLLSAEWKSRNKIVARSGPCKGRGDIIVTTRSGGEGTSTVQFRGYHESIGPVKESAVWVEESAPAALPWGRRPMSPTAYTPPDPLGLSTEGDDYKFPEEELHELFPDGSGKLTDDNFQPGWYLLEHHSNTSFEDLKAGLVFLQRKVEGQKEGQLSFLKANTGAVMDQLDRLVLLKNMYEDDQRKNGREPLPSLQAAIEESISLADSLFSEILSRKENADKTREALSMLTRHKFLFQLPASIDKNIKKKEYDLVVNDYTRVKNLFGNTDVKLFQKILDEIDKKIEELKENLHLRMKTMPCDVQQQTKYIRLLLSLAWEGDAAWEAVSSRQQWLMALLHKVRAHFRRRAEGPGSWCACACAALAQELHALWPLARRYFAGELGGRPSDPQRHADLKAMVIAAVELFADHMRQCLMGGSGAPGSLAPEALRARLVANLAHLRDAYESLLKLDLPSQPLAIVEKVIFEYRSHGMTVFLQRALRRVKALADRETWKIQEYTDYGAITALPHLLESGVSEALASIHKCVVGCGRRESPLLAEGGQPLLTLHKLTQQILVAFVAVLEGLVLEHEEEFDNGGLSVLLEQALEESPEGGSRSWQQKLLIASANAQYTRRVVLERVAAAFERSGVAEPREGLAAARVALSRLESRIGDKYVEQKGDPLVGTVEPSMFRGRHQPASAPADARPYVYELVHNLIAVHAEADGVCGPAASRFVRDICETVCEEVARLAPPPSRPPSRPAALRARLDCALLRLALAGHLTAKAENYLAEALAGLPPLDAEEEKRMESLIEGFKKKMALQLACLNCNLETI